MPRRAPWPVLVTLLLLLAAFGLRVRAAARPGLWADEIFSLAMATGHSLEHPAAGADPAFGDFVQAIEAEAPAAYRRYAELGDEPAGPGLVVRAVLLSDTSPPLYYLLLNLWTRGLGTSDAAVRAFSVWWALATLPLLWLLGRELGGPAAACSACLLFSFSPVGLFYSVEGRMYSLLWFLAAALTWLTLRFAEEGGRWRRAVLWVLAGSAGLLTHYFFAFAWVACVAWLCLDAATRRRAAICAVATALAVLPWYAQVPASLARWRVSGDWLDGALDWPGALARPFALAAGLLAGSSDLGGWRWADGVTIAVALAVVVGLVRGGSGRVMIARPATLLWASLLTVCAGPLVFDLARATTSSTIPRYVLPGLPAAVLLVALAMSRLPRRVHGALLALLLVAWLPGAWKTAAARVPRPNQPYPELDARLEAWAQPGDVVLVRSIPSGVLGVARYLKRDLPMVSWVTQLGTRRVPADLERVLRGRQRVALVTIHVLGASDPVEPWLRANARLLGRETFRRSSAEILYFAPASGAAFFAASGVAVRWE
jgi:4-amino-4-deoxy-L-arabinose transferase-like glycosyltransferase